MEDSTDDRIIRLLALVLLHQMKGSPLHEKAKQLRLAGFSNVEIADLLDTTAASIAQSLYQSKSSRTRQRLSKQLLRKRR